MSSIDDAVLSEFGRYYIGDALPSIDEIGAILPELARGTASRLVHSTDWARLPELVKLLGNLRDDPAHPLHGHIMNATEIYWPDVPEMWIQFQTLMNLVIGHIRAEIERA